MDELKTLVDHYSTNVLQGKSIVIRLEILTQWRIVRQDTWTSRQEQNNTTEGLKTTLWKQTKTADFWAAILAPLYHDLQHFVQIHLVLVLSSVPCERLFHKMNLQKDFLKTRMLTDLLDDKMMITENGTK